MIVRLLLLLRRVDGLLLLLLLLMLRGDGLPIRYKVGGDGGHHLLRLLPLLLQLHDLALDLGVPLCVTGHRAW